MTLEVAPPETDLFVPRPSAGDAWDPWRIHTHYFGFCIPEAQLGAFLYIRYQPSFPLCGAGVTIYRGLDNVSLTTIEHIDYELTMPWPEIAGGKITTANGLSVDFVEPGRQMHISYASADARTVLELDAVAVTPLCARASVAPDEAGHGELGAGGSEQFMHITGELSIADERFEIACHYPRDRSWNQIRTESSVGYDHPPIAWTPVYFGEHLAFNQMGFEDPSSDPIWADDFSIPEGTPTHNWGWVCRHGELLELARVSRRVTRIHPVHLAPLAMEMEIEDERGCVSVMRGEAIAYSPLPAWHNLSAMEATMRWEDETGSVGHGPAQTLWGPKAGRAMRKASTLDVGSGQAA